MKAMGVNYSFKICEGEKQGKGQWDREACYYFKIGEI